MKFTGLSTPEIIALAFSKLHPSHRQTMPTNKETTQNKVRTARAPTDKRKDWVYPTKDLPATETRSSKRNDYIEQDLCDAMAIVKAVGSLPTRQRLWAMYAYADGYEHYHGEVINHVLAQLNDDHLPVFENWRESWEKFGQVYRLVSFLVGAVRSRVEVTNISMSGAIGLTDEGNFRPSRQWGQLKSAIDNVQNGWDQAVFAAIETIVDEMRERRVG